MANVRKRTRVPTPKAPPARRRAARSPATSTPASRTIEEAAKETVAELRARVTAYVKANHQDLADQGADLIKRAGEFPDEVADTAMAGEFGDFIKEMMTHHKAAEAARVASKEPHLVAERAVDGFFKPILVPLKRAKERMEGTLGRYLRSVEREERRKREEEEQRAREEADRLAAQAVTVEDRDLAREANHAVHTATKATGVKAADLSRVRGVSGSVSSLTTTWDFQIEDHELVDLEEIRAHIPLAAIEQAVRSYVKAGGRELEGVKIFERHDAGVR